MIEAKLYCNSCEEFTFHNGEDRDYVCSICNTDKWVTRRTALRLARAPVVAQILAEEYGSVDAFMEREGLTFEPGSDEERIYRQIKQGQIVFTKELEAKLKE